MKKLSLFTLAVITLMAVTSCSKIADKLTVDVPTDVSVDLVIPEGTNELKSIGLRPFYSVDTLDIATNATVIEYQERIKAIAAKGGTLTFSMTKSSLQSINLRDFTLKITNIDTGVLLGTWSLESKFYKTDLQVTIGEPTSGSLADISTALDDKAKIKIEVSGNCDLISRWTMRFTIQTIVKASIF